MFKISGRVVKVSGKNIIIDPSSVNELDYVKSLCLTIKNKPIFGYNYIKLLPKKDTDVERLFNELRGKMVLFEVEKKYYFRNTRGLSLIIQSCQEYEI